MEGQGIPVKLPPSQKLQKSDGPRLGFPAQIPSTLGETGRGTTTANRQARRRVLGCVDRAGGRGDRRPQTGKPAARNLEHKKNPMKPTKTAKTG